MNYSAQFEGGLLYNGLPIGCPCPITTGAVTVTETIVVVIGFRARHA